jgi:hypothetical protein
MLSILNTDRPKPTNLNREKLAVVVISKVLYPLVVNDSIVDVDGELKDV